LARRFCVALHDIPEERRAACCTEKPGLVVTSECERTLSAAIAVKAVALDAPGVEACERALRAAYEGCEWPGPFMPDVPDECLRVIRGLVPEGARCRSSLECEGDLRCQGATPTTTGRCHVPAVDGQRCGGSADTLATYTRQHDVDARHPECKGYCSRTRCAPITEIGGACAVSAACGKSALCVGGKCVAAALPAIGEACLGDACQKGAVCVKGKCLARKAAGATCTTDFECLGACNKSDGGAVGTCGKRCSKR
jgi:hypothetical protein